MMRGAASMRVVAEKTRRDATSRRTTCRVRGVEGARVNDVRVVAVVVVVMDW
jgi:hypothetical protein